MNNKLRLLALPSLLLAQTTFAGIVGPPQTTSVPVDSPWFISGLILTLAVIGVRLLQNRRK